jgi:hypothetical protein
MIPQLPDGSPQLLKSLVANTDALVASVAGVGATMHMADTMPLDGTPMSLLSYLPAILGPALVVVVNRLLAVRAAKLRARAAILESEAASELADANNANDAEAKKKQLEAAELKAEADALVAGRQ